MSYTKVTHNTNYNNSNFCLRERSELTSCFIYDYILDGNKYTLSTCGVHAFKHEGEKNRSDGYNIVSIF